MKPLIRSVLVLFILYACAHPQASAAVLVPPLFGDNMVLQESKPGLPPVTIWGWADEGEKVTINFRGRDYPRSRRFTSKVKKDRRWEIKLGQLKPGGPERLEIIGNNSKITLTNVVVGQVWLVGTQPPPRVVRPRIVDWNPQATRSAQRLRFFPAPHWTREGLKPDSRASWAVSSPDPGAFPRLSSLAFYLGHTLMNESKDGFIAIIEAPYGELRNLGPADKALLDRNKELKAVQEASYRSRQRAYEEYHEALQGYKKRQEIAILAGRPFTELPPQEIPWTKNIAWGGPSQSAGEPVYTANGSLW